MKNFIHSVLFILVVFFIATGNAQDLTCPSKPKMKLHVDTNYRVSIKFPQHWSLDRPLRNEIWLSVGELRGENAGCFVRVSEVENLRYVTPEYFFSQMDEKSFVKLNSIGMPDIKVHLYDMAYLSGRPARRVAYSGTDSEIKTASITYQALEGDRIFTVGCLSEAATFQLLFNDFESIITSFKFEKSK